MKSLPAEIVEIAFLGIKPTNPTNNICESLAFFLRTSYAFKNKTTPTKTSTQFFRPVQIISPTKALGEGTDLPLPQAKARLGDGFGGRITS